MARCPTQAVLPLVGLTAETVIRDRYKSFFSRPDGNIWGPEYNIESEECVSLNQRRQFFDTVARILCLVLAAWSLVLSA
ncbi:MAG: hypothetical protein R6U98_25810 [Pirellulaceae bacterium]